MKKNLKINESFSLGQVLLSNRIVQAPLAGISCSAFRSIIHQCSQPAFTMTEMISAKSLLHSSSQQMHRYLHLDEREKHVICQLSGHDLSDLVKAIHLLKNHGFLGFDLNAGCPMPKIRKNRCGSWWVDHPDQLCLVLEGLKKTFPEQIIGVKVRLSNKLTQDWLKRFEATGIDYITVHGRTHFQHYETPCSYQGIAELIQSIDIPVIGNGDVFDYESLEKMLSTGVDAVMVGRASIGHPELINHLKAGTSPCKSMKRSFQYFSDHLRSLGKLIPEPVAIQQSFRWLPKYLDHVAIDPYLNEKDINQYLTKLEGNLEFTHDDV